MGLLRDLWATSPRRAALVACLVVLGALGTSTGYAAAGPVLIRHSRTMFVVLAAALLLSVLSDLLIGLLTARLTADWTADIRRRLCRSAFGQPLPALETTPVGELLDRIDSDVSQVAGELRGSGVRIVQALTTTVVSMGAALLVWWPAGVALIALSTGLAITLARPVGRIGPARMLEEEAWSDLAAVTEEAIHGQDDVRTSLARPYVLKLFAQRASQVLSRGVRVWRMASRVTLIAVIAAGAAIATVVVGGAWALNTGRVDAARLTAVWLLVLAYALTAEHISRMLPDLQYALGAWGRIMLLRGAAQEPVGGSAPSSGDLAIQGLTFRYGDGPPALRGVDLSFARGRSYALIGRTGSGKSTLAKVLSRAVDVPRGTVFLGGADLLDLDVERLRRYVAIVPQRTEILAGTLAENIALFDPELLGVAADAVTELGLSAWVADLPDGIDTRLGDGGYVLSAGQEQLVAFARILVRDPQVVILDEATARLDPVTETRVHQATARLLRGRIGIVIAHRLSSVRACDEVVVLSDGAVVEAGPLRESERFAQLLATSHGAPLVGVPAGGGGVGLLDAPAPEEDEPTPPEAIGGSARPKVEPPPLPPQPPVRTVREILRLVTNDPRYGLAAVAMFSLGMVLGVDGVALPWLWANLVDGVGSLVWPAVGIVAALVVLTPTAYFTGLWFPYWWVRQMLRISQRLVYGQTGPYRISSHTPAEVVAQAGDTERVVVLADNVVDQSIAVVTLVAMTVVSGSVVPGLFFLGTMVLSGLGATLFGPRLAGAAKHTVTARAKFATALVSSLSAARTVKLAGASGPVLAHLAQLDRVRSDRFRREVQIQVWARSMPSVLSGLLPIGAWGMYLAGSLSAAATLIAVSTLGAARWFAWTTASLVSHLPSARVWTARTVEMAGTGAYSASVPGVDLAAGTAPAPDAAPRHPLRELELAGFGAVHEDGTVGVHGVDVTVRRGELVLVLGQVGSGKSSLLRALAGIVHHSGTLSWNGQPVDTPEVFLRPNQVAYVAQLPRVLSGTVSDNVRLGHEVDAASAVSTAQLDHDLAATGGGLGLVIGHKGVRLSGGQLQRLALARALAPRTELLIADDISSALDVTTELDLWRALREHGVTVVGSTSKRAALAQADHVVVLQAGTAVAQGPWRDLADRWGHLAG
jgi:ATP-binding cassette, subfamily B, bacterial